MPERPLRFIHAADLHLERVPAGLAEVPDHLRAALLEAPLRAAEGVFDAALAEQVDFLLLAGDVVEPRLGGPRAMKFLLEQFARLAERDIEVYWAGGRVDPPESWPEAVALPDNVYRFDTENVDSLVYARDGLPLARVVGLSRKPGSRRKLPLADFRADDEGLPTVAVAHGRLDEERAAKSRVQYFALGGGHSRATLARAPRVVHVAGTPQGRAPAERGPHGCTLVEIGTAERPRTRLIPTDVVRFVQERLVIDESAHHEQLRLRLAERMQALIEAAARRDLLVWWRIAGQGPLVEQLRGGGLAEQLLGGLRDVFGRASPAAWSVAVECDVESLPPSHYEEETIRGDYLRLVRQYLQDDALPLDVESYLSAGDASGALGAAVALDDRAARREVLGEAALLGASLLGGETALLSGETSLLRDNAGARPWNPDEETES